MTVTTYLWVGQPADPEVVFAEALRGMGVDPGTATTERNRRGIWTRPGSGYPAWLMLRHDAGARIPAQTHDPLLYGPGPCTHDHEPAHYVRLCWDTALAAGVLSLHARLVAQMGGWLGGQGITTWWWRCDHDQGGAPIHRGYEGLGGLA